MKNPDFAGRPLTVLILEDNPLDNELAEARLEQAGYDLDVTVARSRGEFEQAYPSRTWDLILADYSLPDFDGLSALEMVRRHDKHIPFIFVSGVLGEEVAVETLQRGATDYVLKARLDRLPPAVARALKEYSDHLSRLQAEMRLRETEQLFQQLTNALPAMVWTANGTGELTYCNDSWREYFGTDFVEHWCHSSVIHIEDLSQTRRQWQDAMAAGKALELECRFRRAGDNVYRWHLVRIVPLRLDGSRSAWVGTCTDIHTQKLREESLRVSEKLAVVGRMAGAIAHEINNPLESLVNLLYLLRDSDTRIEPGRGLLEEADQQLFRISSITRQTLTFYRDKAALGDIDCRSLFEDTISLFRPKLLTRQIQPQLTVESHVHLQGITGEIRQVVINLVSNAIDASLPGGTLHLRAATVTRPQGDYVQLQVEDSGRGIPESTRKQLFQPFFTTKGSLGTGLGLWVSKSIVDKHHGEIQIESKPGRTLISVLLPAEYRGSSSAPEGAGEAWSEPLPPEEPAA